MHIVHLPLSLAPLRDLLADKHTEYTFNFAEHTSDAEYSLKLLNPPWVIRFLRSKTRLYHWLRKQNYAILPQLKPKNNACITWPLWTLGARPTLCNSPSDALATSATRFASAYLASPHHRAYSTLQRVLIAGGQVIRSEAKCCYAVHPADSWQECSVSPTLERCLHEITVLTGAELYWASVAVDPTGLWSILDVDPAHTVDLSDIALIAKALETRLMRTTQNQTPAWLIVMLWESILPALMPQEARWAWRYDKNTCCPVLESTAPLPPWIQQSIAALGAHPHVLSLTNIPMVSPPMPFSRNIIMPSAWRQQGMEVFGALESAGFVSLPSNEKEQIRRRIQLSCPLLPMECSEQPVLGVLTKLPRSWGQPFGYDTLHLQQLSQLAQAYGLQLHIFSPEDVDSTQSCCSGFAWVDNTWRRMLQPLPRLVYLRGTGFSPDELQSYETCQQYLQQQDVQFLNEPAFNVLLGDKHLLHQLLETHPTFQCYLPETKPYSWEALRDMLRQYACVYIKPVDGHESRGLIRLEQSAEDATNHFISSAVYNDRSNTLHRWERLSVSELAIKLSKLPLQGYIVQQGIATAVWEESTIELRLLCQRLGSTWLPQDEVLRMAGSEQLGMITARRERWERPDRILSLCFPGKDQALLSEARGILQSFCTLIDSLGLVAMEFSLDLLVDQSGKLYILEANAKPSSFAVQLGDDDARRQGLRYKIQHTLWMMQQRNDK